MAEAGSCDSSYEGLVYRDATHRVAELQSRFGGKGVVSETELAAFHGLLGTAGTGKDRQVLRFSGFVHAVRDHGDVLFIELRDGAHILQIVTARDLTPQSFDVAKQVRPESSLSAEGLLRRRPPDTENPEDPLGRIELVGTKLVIHGSCHGMPYPVHDDAAVHESVKLRHRYLQLRKSGGLVDVLRFRSHFVHHLRQAFLAESFVEVETPVLFRSTPEGSRDFVVPSRLHKGHFYALVQSPQLLKQLLMVGGLERYMQVCRCFRDEDPRADRQPEFTQLDLEAAFLEPASFRAVVARALATALRLALPEGACADDLARLCFGDGHIATMTYDEAMHRYGTDKPDLTFDLPLYDGGAALVSTRLETFRRLLDQGALLKFLFLPSGTGELSRSFLDTLPDMAKSLGGQGLAWLRKQPDGSWQGPIAKFLSESELLALCEVVRRDDAYPLASEAFGPGAMLFFSCHAHPKVVFGTMNSLRLQLARELQIPRRRWALRWVTDFPLMEWDSAEKRLVSCHHPFTMPHPKDVAEIMACSADQVGSDHARRWCSSGYDLVLNGAEIGGGSARIHDARLQDKILSLFGMDERVRKENFGFLLEALQMGAPPHCGMALGLDRIVAMLQGLDSIRDVIAFPKTGQGQCLMSGAPGPLTREQWRELGIMRS